MANRGDSRELKKLLEEIKDVSKRYHELTGRPLGCVGEVAELEAARHLGLKLSPVRQPGFDAIRHTPDGEERVQIKGRAALSGTRAHGRMGRIDRDKEWDSVVLVLLDENLDAFEIHEADRETVIAALEVPGSKARDERSQLSVANFKSIGDLVWSSA